MKDTLTKKLEVLLEADWDKENLVDIIDTKLYLNWEIDKKKRIVLGAKGESELVKKQRQKHVFFS